jgi:hypothetical protein
MIAMPSKFELPVMNDDDEILTLDQIKRNIKREQEKKSSKGNEEEKKNKISLPLITG